MDFFTRCRVEIVCHTIVLLTDPLLHLRWGERKREKERKRRRGEQQDGGRRRGEQREKKRERNEGGRD